MAVGNPYYGMPNAYVGNLDQSPGQIVGGYLQASDANQLLQPGVPSGAAPPNRLAPWSNFGGDESFDDYWREQARALAANPNDYGQPEPLPGITSGAPPKPWGLNRDQPLYNQLPAYGPGGRGVRHWIDELGRIRPMQDGVDPGMTLGDEAIPGTRSPTPVIMQERPAWKYRET